jgi:hypothetical protein
MMFVSHVSSVVGRLKSLFIPLFVLDFLGAFYICGSVHHQSILLNNQHDAALSSCIYYSLRE